MSLFSSATDFLGDPLNLLGGDEAKAAAEKQLAAQNAALEQQQAETAAAREQLGGISDQARQDITGYSGQAAGALQDMYGQQQGYFGQGANALGMGQQQGLASLAGGYGQARGDIGQVAQLQQYGAGAAQSINPYDVTGQKSQLAGLMQRGDALSQRIDKPVNLEEDPGYKFRLEQGEQAINRSAAAKGGRLGGATLKALAGYGQDLASQEYGQAFARKSSQDQAQASLLGQQYGAAGNVDQMRQQSLLNQAGRSDAASLAAQQNQMNLAQLGYGAQSQMGQMAYGYGGDQANMWGQYGQNLSGLYGQQAGAAGAQGSALSGLYSGTGENLANAGLGMAGQYTNLATGMNQLYGENAGHQGMVEQSQANQKGQMAGAAGGIIGAF